MVFSIFLLFLLDIITLSKRLMLKSFITFTKTDATRLYNRAEIKNVVIKYLQEYGFIKQIDDLFLSTSPTKRVLKPEIGYLKLFPVSRSASDTAEFETKLREKIGITFDDYVNKVFNGQNPSVSSSGTNNMFNTTYHNWLLNRHWYDKLKEGHTSDYYQNNVICPDMNMSLIMVNVASISNDSGKTSFYPIFLLLVYYFSFFDLVHDSFDCPRSKLTASQRTNKELRRLGAKRQNDPGDEPSSKRQRKPKRFADDE
jgi:hypothetical protein